MTTYTHIPFNADLRAQLTANLAKLPPHRRFKGKSTPQCDFCSSDNPVAMYAANRLSTGEPKQCLRWLACLECHTAITKNDFRELEHRAQVGYGMPGDRAAGVIKAMLLQFHADAMSTSV